MREVDLLIIGSGPAGISTALHMLQRDSGWAERMILIEKSAHPRPKLCAGGVTRIGLETLRDLGLDLPLPIPNVEIEEARFIYKNRTIRVRGEPEFVVYNRIELDAFLSNYAHQQGVRIQEHESVQNISRIPGGYSVKTSQDTYHARVIVGADGSKGATRKMVKKQEKVSRVARVIEAVSPAQESLPVFTENYAVFDLTPSQEKLQGYYWVFPSRVDGKPTLNRGVYDSRIAPARDRANLPGIFMAQTAGDEGAIPADEIKGHPLHWFSPGNRFSMHHLLLVGDAAGVDPLLGEGIGPALAYGKLAAEEVSNAFRRSDFSFRYYKLRLLTSRVGRSLMFRWFLAWVSYQLNWSRLYMYGLWFVGNVLSILWPKPEPLYLRKPSQFSRLDDRIEGSTD